MNNLIKLIFEDLEKEIKKAKEKETSLYTMSYNAISNKAFEKVEDVVSKLKNKYLGKKDVDTYGKIISDSPLTPQEYLEIVTGKTYLVNGINQVEETEDILSENEFMLWSYPLTETDYVLKNNLRVVLVECINVVDSGTEKCYRWFEVPECVTSETIEEYFEG